MFTRKLLSIGQRTIQAFMIGILALVFCAITAQATEVEKFSDEWYAQEYGEYGFSSQDEYYGTVDLVAKFADKKVPDVRVNGHIVTFPDGQPYIDDNGRTLMPVRFVTEALGADVSWDGATSTAVIEKNGITVKVPIGSSEITVTKNNRTTTVTMDTAAVINSGRTYVPIRFVAEALGAYVDYSTTCKTVGIYNDVLTKSQIEFLLSLDYATQDHKNVGYVRAISSGKKSAEEIIKWFGSDRETFKGNFANAREHVYRSTGIWVGGDYQFEQSGIKLDRAWSNGQKVGNYKSTAEYVDAAIKEVRATYGYDCISFSSEVYTDASCVYQGNGYNGDLTVRTIVKYTPKLCFPGWFLTEEDYSHLERLHLVETSTMDPQYIVLDVVVVSYYGTVYCEAALPQTTDLSREACHALGFEGGSDFRWSEESNFSDFVYEYAGLSSLNHSSHYGNHIAKLSNSGGDSLFYAIVSSRDIWVIDDEGVGSWKTIDVLDCSKQMIDSKFDGTVKSVINEDAWPTQYRKIVKEDGSITYVFGQWQSEYVSNRDAHEDFWTTLTATARQDGEAFARDNAAMRELAKEFQSSWVFVPGGYVQDSTGQWVFQGVDH